MAEEVIAANLLGKELNAKTRRGRSSIRAKREDAKTRRFEPGQFPACCGEPLHSKTIEG